MIHPHLLARKRNAVRLRTSVSIVSLMLLTAFQTAYPSQAFAQQTDDKSAASEPVLNVDIRSGRPTSLPTSIPTTIEGTTAGQIQRTVNATDSSDALKYFPSLLVRKRYIGDFDHAVLATRASGTGNSARSLVYADGILLSNLLGNGAAFTPRWGLVTPEEIERVDVLYGPFSAAYSGNSVGAVVDYVTRMPTQFEANAKTSVFSQKFNLYNSSDKYGGNQIAGSVGSAEGPWAWWVSAARTASDGQPLAFANRLVSAGTVTNTATPVTGAVQGLDPQNRPWVLFGTNSQINTVQEHLKAKLAYSFTPEIKLSYTFGWWKNDAQRQSDTYLRDAAGNPVYSGAVNVAGRSYTLAATDFPLSSQNLEHQMYGLSLKSNTKITFDWELAASTYRYGKDETRTSGTPPLGAGLGGIGRIADLGGTGWNTLAARVTWRPDGNIRSTHTIDAGIQKDSFSFRSLTSDTTDWRSGVAGARFIGSAGDTSLTSLYIQDTWRIDAKVRATIGLRHESWDANNGAQANAATVVGLASRSSSNYSPKAAISYDVSNNLTLKTSIGRAVRYPTVGELYQGSVANGVVINNDPTLKPERSVTTEVSAEYALERGLLRATMFRESTHDALYSQTNVTVTPNVTNIQNVDQIRTLGFELAAQTADFGIKGLSAFSSLTYTDSDIVANAKFPASVGSQQPRVPKWRANVLLSYQATEKLTTTLGLRYSGQQFGTLNNVDTNGQAYTGFSKFLVADIRARCRFSKNWIGSAGIDNISNAKYWAFHPYPQRTLHADLKYAF
jgi:iron complex outermembrane recepter protein